MKKLLGIVVLGLLWCNVGIAAEINNYGDRSEIPEDAKPNEETLKILS